MAFVQNKSVKKYCQQIPFDPPVAYLELPFINKIDYQNTIYQMVRDLFVKLELDKANIDTPRWNPFRDIVRPGNKVLIKPNLVTSSHYLGPSALLSSIIQGSFLRPIIDYVYLALEGEGSVTIADNPIENADFDGLMKFTGITEMVNLLTNRGYKKLKVIDLRPKILSESKKGKFYYESQPGDPLGYVTIDLEKFSLFGDFDNHENIHYYTLADQTVDHFDPKYSQESATDKYHGPDGHKYLVSRSFLDAEVIINVAKLKTHCKAGVSLSLKNIIGIVYLKECMPHHRPGPPPRGDAFLHYPATHYVAARKLYRTFRRTLQIHRLPGFRSVRNFLQRNEVLIQQHVEHGNWKGNDTIWRTILDLNRIAVYADREGVMRETPQRKFFIIIDGIVGQQGNGPMCGEPVNSSIIFGGFNPVAVDALAVKSMGIDPYLIPSISKARNIGRWKLLPHVGFDITLPGINPPNFRFLLPKGWT